MILTNGLKRICDVSFYLTFASFLAAFFGGDRVIVTLPIFAVVAFLSAALASQLFLKYVSTLPLVFGFMMVPFGTVNVLTLLPAVAYMIYAIPKPDEKVSQFEYVDVFNLFVKCFVGLIVAALIFQWQEQLENGPLLLGLTFLINATILMRMIRHDEVILKQLRFKAINGLSLVVVMMVVMLFSREAFLTFMGQVISFIWTSVLAPAVWFLWMGMLRGINLIVNLFGLDLSGLFRYGEFGDPEISTEPLEMVESELSEVPMLFFVIFALVVIVLVFKLFYMMSQKHGLRLTNEGVIETRTTLDDDQPKKRKRRSSRNQIREIYGKYLRQLKRNEIEIAPHMTTFDIEEVTKEMWESDESGKLREMYIKVRYGEADFNKEDIKEMKRRYKGFSQELKEGKKQTADRHDFNKK